MHTNLILAVLVLVLFAVLMAVIVRKFFMCCDEIEEVVSVTRIADTAVNGMEVVGRLRRLRENHQWYVYDPVDHKKFWLNDSDDMYEDADGKIWQLV